MQNFTRHAPWRASFIALAFCVAPIAALAQQAPPPPAVGILAAKVGEYTLTTRLPGRIKGERRKKTKQDARRNEPKSSRPARIGKPIKQEA